MSASDKKKLRKEQQTAAMTEKQQAEQKKQKTQQIYTRTFVIVMVLIVAVVLGTFVRTPIINLLMKSTTSLIINGHEISAVEFNYYFMDYINNFYNQFSNYGSEYQDIYVQLYTGLNPTITLDSQVYDKETGETWAQFFTKQSIESAKWTYTLYDEAIKAGYEMTDSEKLAVENASATMEYYAAYYGYNNGNAYLKAIYGGSASLESYTEYLRVSTLASSYANSYYEGLEFTNEQYREYEAGKEKEYNSYSYAYYYLKADNYLTGGTTTKDENGKETTTYTEAEKQAARDAALADAKLLAESGYKTVEELNEAIKNLAINAEKETPPTATEASSVLYSSLPSVKGMADWISDAERKSGDMTYLANTTHTHTDGTTHAEDEENTEKHDVVNGYYVVLQVETIDNTMSIGSVRHLLIMFKNADGKTYSDGIKEFTDEQKAEAYNTAEDLLKEFNSGDKTEDSFIKLVKNHSQDTGSKSSGGLIESINPDSGYVKNFTAWAIADHEKGDVEIIETEYGYHVMYYVEADELNYRDTLIDNTMRQEEYTEWQDALLETTQVQEENMKYVDTDYVISK